MSALRKPQAPPRPRRLTAKDSMYAGLHAADVQDNLRSTSFSGLALLPDLVRMCRNRAQIQFVMSVYFHTQGCPQHGDFFVDRWHGSKAKQFRKPAYCEPMLPEDFAKEPGFTRQAFSDVMVAEERVSLIQDAIDRGIVERKCECGKSRPPVADRASCPEGDDHYRFRPLVENWRNVVTVDFGVNLRKPVQSELDKADQQDEEEANSQATTVARVVKVRAKSRFKMVAGTRYVTEEAGVKEILYDVEAPASARVDDHGVLRMKSVSAKKPPAPIIPMPAAPAKPETPARPAAETAAPSKAAAAQSPAPPTAELGLVKKLMPSLAAPEAAELATRAAAVDLAKYREFHREIVERWRGDIQDSFMRLVVARSQQLGAPHGLDPNDQIMARAVRAETKPSQKSAGLYLTTIPNWIERHARSLESGKSEQPKQRESIFARKAREVGGKP